MRAGNLNIENGLFLGEKELNLMNTLTQDLNKLLLTKTNQKGLFNLSKEGFKVNITGNSLSFSGEPSLLGFDSAGDLIVYDIKKSVNIPTNTNGYIYISTHKSSLEDGVINISTTGDIIGTGTSFQKLLRGSIDKRISKIKVDESIYNILTVIDDTHITISNPPSTNLSGKKYSIIGTYSPYIGSNKELYNYFTYSIDFSSIPPSELTQFKIGTIIWSNSLASFSWSQESESIISSQNSISLFDTEISTSEELLNIHLRTSAVNILVKRGIYNITLNTDQTAMKLANSVKYVFAERGTILKVDFKDAPNSTAIVCYSDSKDCKIENFTVESVKGRTATLNTAFIGFSEIRNCTSKGFSNAFYGCNKLSNCIATFAGTLSGTTASNPVNPISIPVYAKCLFYNCRNVLYCEAEVVQPISVVEYNAFVNCQDLYSCKVTGSNFIGFDSCQDIYSCKVLSPSLYAFYLCTNITNPSVNFTKSENGRVNSYYLFNGCRGIIRPFINITNTTSIANVITVFESCKDIIIGDVNVSASGSSSIIACNKGSGLKGSNFTLSIDQGYLYGVKGDDSNYNDLISDNTFNLNNANTLQEVIGISHSKRCRGNNLIFLSQKSGSIDYQYCYPTQRTTSKVDSSSVGGFNESNIIPARLRILPYHSISGVSDLYILDTRTHTSIPATSSHEIEEYERLILNVRNKESGSSRLEFNHKVKSITDMQSGDPALNVAIFSVKIENSQIIVSWPKNTAPTDYVNLMFTINFELNLEVNKVLVGIIDATGV